MSDRLSRGECHRRDRAIRLPLALVLAAGLGLAVSSLGCAKPSPTATEPEVLVFAAASLRDALTAVTRDFQRENPDARVRFSFAGSNALAQQLMAAPRADLYFSASETWMDRVADAGAIEPGSRRALLGNQLVVVVNRDVELQLTGICELLDTDLERLVLGDPNAVPAGIYARQYLEATTCPGGASAWSALRSRVVPTSDVRAALAHSEASQHVAAIVYQTDAATSDRVRVALTIADDRAPPIVYPVALVRGHTGPAPQRLLAYLGSAAARRVFEQHGFRTLEANARRPQAAMPAPPP